MQYAMTVKEDIQAQKSEKNWNCNSKSTIV